ncbi:phosphonate ABC transporter, permease protein PhnE [Ethanoligenens harbinense]|uniref:phosphonate ABC transporter, permease protein PhnE n=1 Tax=Ethanoligenens harbinense TaxID=253239 RepID=UPI000EA35ED1|nr:phosphonate ABC transporter, permease protein PhnE [Ethanoligenens harbinense]AYF41779.1 phosphonate ABC transporter, permease protein PhnE [Ethanoligenens harbinense]
MTAAIEQKFRERPVHRAARICTMVVVLALFFWSATVVQPNAAHTGGWKVAKGILLGLIHPDAALLFNFTQQGVAYLMLETVCIAFLGTLVGAVLAIPFAFLSAANIVSKPVAFFGRLAVMAVRTVPPIIYGLMFIRVTGPGPFAGLLTMSLCSIGMLSKMYAEAIEELDGRILESLDAAGCGTFAKIRYGILPQLIPGFLSVIIYRFDMNLRDAAVLGLVGAGGIGAPLLFAMNAYRWNQVGAILIWLVVVVIALEYISSKVRVRLVRG